MLRAAPTAGCLAALLLSACVSAGRTAVVTARPWVSSDLPAALRVPSPTAATCGEARCVPAGVPTRVTLDPHRDEAVRVWRAYVTALCDRSLPEVAALFAPLVGGLQGGAAPVSREQLMMAYELILPRIDPGGRTVSEVMDPTPLEIRGLTDFAPNEAYRPTTMRPGDLWVSGALRLSVVGGGMASPQTVPQTFLLRWIDGRARIVGVMDALVRRIP